MNKCLGAFRLLQQRIALCNACTFLRDEDLTQQPEAHVKENLKLLESFRVSFPGWLQVKVCQVNGTWLVARAVRTGQDDIAAAFKEIAAYVMLDLPDDAEDWDAADFKFTVDAPSFSSVFLQACVRRIENLKLLDPEGLGQGQGFEEAVDDAEEDGETSMSELTKAKEAITAGAKDPSPNTKTGKKCSADATQHHLIYFFLGLGFRRVAIVKELESGITGCRSFTRIPFSLKYTVYSLPAGLHMSPKAGIFSMIFEIETMVSRFCAPLIDPSFSQLSQVSAESSNTLSCTSRSLSPVDRASQHLLSTLALLGPDKWSGHSVFMSHSSIV